MKKRMKLVSFIIGSFAIFGMGYNLWAYQQLKEILVPDNIVLPPIVDSYTIGILVSFLFVAIFHLLLLFHTFYFLPKMTRRHFWGALFFCSLVLSGLYIASDAALLHDLGNEYLFWDISMEWVILFTTSILQLALMLIGFVILAADKTESPFALFPKAEKFDENMFIIVTQVGLICGVIGLAMLPMPKIMGVTDHYRDGFLITLTILALLPFTSSIIYWLIRNRGKEFSQILDEKQFQDVSFGGLIATFILIIAIVFGLILSKQGMIDLNNPIYGLLSIDLLVIAINSAVLIRSRI